MDLMTVASPKHDYYTSLFALKMERKFFEFFLGMHVTTSLVFDAIEYNPDLISQGCDIMTIYVFGKINTIKNIKKYSIIVFRHSEIMQCRIFY